MYAPVTINTNLVHMTGMALQVLFCFEAIKCWLMTSEATLVLVICWIQLVMMSWQPGHWYPWQQLFPIYKAAAGLC